MGIPGGTFPRIAVPPVRRGGSPLALAALAVALATLAMPAARAQDKAMAEGKALFVSGAVPPCAVCHTLKDAGTSGAIGPVLDELKPDAARVATALKSGIGAMPSYQGTLTDAQIDALARYVAAASRK